MKIEKITVTRGKKINLGNYETENYEISMSVNVEGQDDPHDVVHGIKKILDQKLIHWELSLKDQGEISQIELNSVIKTADQLIENETEVENKVLEQEITQVDNHISSENNTYICPKCKEIMQQKEGKNYYLCSSHWGYPDMISKGEVRDKQF